MNKLYPFALILLFVICGYLLYKQLKPSPTHTTSGYTSLGGTAVSGTLLPMAFFDIDSINENYAYCIEVKAKLEKMKDNMDEELSKMQANLESTQQGFQKKNAQAPLSPQEQENAMATLQKMQQNIGTKRDQFISEFEAERKKSELSLKKDIQEFIRTYNTPQKFSYIVADEPGVFFYKDSLYDITTTVLEGLNGAYKAKVKN